MSKLETARQLAKQTTAQEPSTANWERQPNQSPQPQEWLDKHYTLNPATVELFKMVILDQYANDTVGHKEFKVSLAKQLTDFNSRLSKVRELLLAGDLDGTDYKETKAECERGILVVEAQLGESGKNKYTNSQLEPIIDKAIITYANLNVIYCKSDNEEKRRLIGSMFPEKITFENLKHRTAKVHDGFTCIYLINKELKR